MTRSLARPATIDEQDDLGLMENPGKFEEFWPEEPTAVEAATTMEELILDELRRQGAVASPANDGARMARKGTRQR
jgi:hypothetical protein